MPERRRTASVEVRPVVVFDDAGNAAVTPASTAAAEAAFREERAAVLATLDPPARRLPARRGRAAGRLRRGDRRVGARRRPAAPRARGSRRRRAARRSTACAATARSPTASSASAQLAELETRGARTTTPTTSAVGDDRLRLIFTCCHPALAMAARVALTLRSLGGLTTGEIARAFLVEEATMAQRIVRAKRKIAAARHPLPDPARRGAARPPGRRARRRLPDLQRGLERVGRRPARARRAVQRGDPPRAGCSCA